MCELFGISTKTEYPTGAFLRSFITHSEEHHSGWGLAVFEDGFASIEKEPVKAMDSQYLKTRLRALEKTGDLLAHIRLATVGYTEYENCHPFVMRDASGRRWVQIHNGTMFEASFISAYSEKQKGTTDSEQMLLYIQDCLNQEIAQKGGALSFDERFAVLDRAVCRLSDGCKLNLMLHDGEYLYVHRNFKDSLYYLQDGNSTLFATTPLTLKDGWKLLPGNRLFAYRDGVKQAEGTDHGHTFEFTEEQLRYLYSAFATL